MARNLSVSDDVWPPGVRFHPTDEELVVYHLKHKICRRNLKLDIIAEVDVYKREPAELPGLSLLKNGDLQWFFFSPKDRKYPHGSRSNRATKQGYWKTTGKDRTITCNSRKVGMKKTLVFYKGRAPSGERTNWVMHEYTLDEDELKSCKNAQDCYAIYKVYKKSGPGPKNGEQYGAPFREEDWVDDDCVDITSSGHEANCGRQVNNVSSTDSCRNSQVDLYLSDIDGLLKQTVDEHSPQPVHIEPSPQPAAIELALSPVKQILEPAPLPAQIELATIDEFDLLLSQFIGEQRVHGTMVNESFGEFIYDEPCISYATSSQLNGLGTRFNLPQSATSGFQMWDYPEVTSTPNTFVLRTDVFDDDFLEIADLFSPEVNQGISDLSLPPLTGDRLSENLQLKKDDGLREFDLYYDADDLFLQDLASNDQVVSYDLCPKSQEGGLANHVGYGMHPYSDGVNAFGSEMLMTHDTNTCLPTTTEPNQGHMPLPTTGGINAIELNQNQIEEEIKGGQSRLSSSLWSFVESIPAPTASAAVENGLVNKAIRRMSSLRRVRIINTKTTTIPASIGVGGVGGRLNKGFFICSFLQPYLQLYACLLVLMLVVLGNYFAV